MANGRTIGGDDAASAPEEAVTDAGVTVTAVAVKTTGLLFLLGVLLTLALLLALELDRNESALERAGGVLGRSSTGTLSRQPRGCAPVVDGLAGCECDGRAERDAGGVAGERRETSGDIDIEGCEADRDVPLGGERLGGCPLALGTWLDLDGEGGIGSGPVDAAQPRLRASELRDQISNCDLLIAATAQHAEAAHAGEISWRSFLAQRV